MAYLALDIGKKRTGIAIADAQSRVPVSLQTYQGAFTNFCSTELPDILSKHKIEHIIVGMPLLPDGSPGAQAHFVQECIERIIHVAPKVVTVHLEDERFTTVSNLYGTDDDASAALQILEQYLNREKYL